MISTIKVIVCTCVLLSTARAEPISGRVVDVAGQPLPETDVVLVSMTGLGTDLSTKTGNDGRFHFRLVPSGDYYIEASRIGFLSVRYHPIVIRYPIELTFDFVLPFDWNNINIEELGRTDARVSGELRRGSLPLSGVEICFASGASRKCVQTNELGQYSTEVVPGEYTVTVSDEVRIIRKQALRIVTPSDYWNLIAVDAKDQQRESLER